MADLVENNKAYLAVDDNGEEWIYGSKPCRNKYYKTWEINYNIEHVLDIIKLPKGTIEKIIGEKLTWNDEPVEIL